MDEAYYPGVHAVLYGPRTFEKWEWDWFKPRVSMKTCVGPVLERGNSFVSPPLS